ncbi:MAG: M48 family metallopeptidase [Proteobacteria bacterium]|nr:M48 family metallopeptidase [Pseudomonadota bacterium]
MIQRFPGRVYYDEQGRAKQADADIEVGDQGLRAESAGARSFDLSYDQCEVERGGASGRVLFCHAPDRSLTMSCERPGFERALIEAAGAGIRQQLASGAETERKNRKRLGLSIGVLAAVLVAVLLGAYLGIRAAGAAVVRNVPWSVDAQIGASAIEGMQLGGPRTSDPVLLEAVQSLVERLRPHVAGPPQLAHERITFHVHVVHSEVVNAFALPGGQIVVFAGLLESAPDPGQVAGVLAHEMAHVTLRHGIERMAQSLGLWGALSLLFGDVASVHSLAGRLIEQGVLTSYGREQESEADTQAVTTLHAAALDPMALAGFFELLEAKQGEQPAAMAWLSSHPQPGDRRAAIADQVSQLARTRTKPLRMDWQTVREHARLAAESTSK